MPHTQQTNPVYNQTHIQMTDLTSSLKQNFKKRALNFVSPEIYEEHIRSHFEDFLENLEEPLQTQLETAVENDSYLDYTDEDA